jgi:hypothetical protein
MSFVKKIAKPLLQVGAGMIPGLGPIASTLMSGALGVGGAALGAFGESGKQGSQKFTGQEDSTTDTTQTTNFNKQTDFDREDLTESEQNQFSEGVDINEATEDPYSAQFRRSLYPQVAGEINRAKQPVYGTAQKAAVLSDLNDLTESGATGLRQALAATGGLDSGSLAAGLGDLETGRLKQAASFYSQLPFQEEQARSARMNPLLNLATQFAGRAPVGNINIRSGKVGQTGKTKGTQTGSQTETGQQTSVGQQNTKGTKSGEQTQEGPGFLKGMAGGLGGLAGDIFGGLGGRNKPKKKKGIRV